jgi:signal transduction histidine kinase
MTCYSEYGRKRTLTSINLEISEIWKKLRLIDWLVLMLTTLCQAVWLDRTERIDPFYLVSFTLLVLAAVFASYVPREKNDRLHLAALALQSLCYTGSMATGAYKLFGLLFLILVFKVALVAERKTTVVLVTIIYFLHVTAQEVSIHLYTSGLHRHFQRTDQQPLQFAEAQLFEIASLCIAAMLARTFLSERRARRQAQQLTKEVEEMAVAVERGRIARDIHDTLGHSLTALNVQLEVTEKLLQSGDMQTAEQSLKESRQLASSAIRDVRKSVQTIQTEDFSLDEAVSAIADRIRKQKQMEIDIAIDDRALSVASRHNILLIVKECLTNVQKHADASQVEIKLAQNGPTAELIVKDNGKGFLLQEEWEGFGIKGMRERIGSLGGTMKIESSPGNGTSINVSVPT